jgi:ArsR family transcriptional regulator, cadmium/lead-responsive transcriptional repressor
MLPRWAERPPALHRAQLGRTLEAMTTIEALSVSNVATLARFFRVLGDPTRLRIIELLHEGDCTVSELVSALDAPQSRVSTHLACLRHCRLVSAERRGREVVYRLAIPRLRALLDRALTVAGPEAEHLATCQRIGPDWV